MAERKGKKNSTSESRACSKCFIPEGSTPKLSACSRCSLVYHCSRDCQKAHWKANHKRYCIAKTARKPQPLNRLESLELGPNEDIEGDQCSICLDQLTDASALKLPCTHVFHGLCVAELRKLGVQQVCPMCRVHVARRCPLEQKQTVRQPPDDMW